MTRPTVSVVIPTHDRPDMLFRAIQSCFEQTELPLEIIVVPNGCSSESLTFIGQEVEALEITEAPIITRTLHNANVSEARNLGVSIARGDYVAFLDDDDRFLATKLEKQVDLLLAFDQELGLLGCLSQTQKPAAAVSDFITIPMAVKNSHMYPSSIIVKTEVAVANPFNTGLKVCEDYEWMVRVSENHTMFRSVDRLFERTIHNGNLTESLKDDFDEIRKRILLSLLPVSGDKLTEHINELIAREYS